MCVHCYKLASDEGRHQILTLLKEHPMSVGQLTERLHVKQPTVSHHLKLLADAGLIRAEKEGKVRRYTLEVDSECFSECGLLSELKR